MVLLALGRVLSPPRGAATAAAPRGRATRGLAATFGPGPSFGLARGSGRCKRRRHVGKLTFIAILAAALHPRRTSRLVVTITACPFAIASSGVVSTTNGVSDVASWGGLTSERVVNMCIRALDAAAFARLPPLKTCALRRIPASLGTTLSSLRAAFGADPSRGGSAQEVVAEAVAALALELRIDLRPKGLVRTIGVIGCESVVDGNVMPNRRVPCNLVIKCSKHRVLVGTSLHLEQTVVPLVHESSEIIVAHLKGLKHAPIVEASIREADLVLLYDRPEKLPSLSSEYESARAHAASTWHPSSSSSFLPSSSAWHDFVSPSPFP